MQEGVAREEEHTLLPVAPSSSRKTMDKAKVASFTYGSAQTAQKLTTAHLAFLKLQKQMLGLLM